MLLHVAIGQPVTNRSAMRPGGDLARWWFNVRSCLLEALQQVS
jgi:hypothetical protein